MGISDFQPFYLGTEWFTVSHTLITATMTTPSQTHFSYHWSVCLEKTPRSELLSGGWDLPAAATLFSDQCFAGAQFLF